ncbi:HTH-type transcriptional regulator norG [Sphingobacterium daejeonense]|nr:HTH-type transcriptional regulator norG [Sphingobacterium daejeonense]
MQLLELSKRYSFVIIEDDYDYDFHYLSSPYLPLASADHAGNVIYIGSFSKILDPSLRVGFMVAPMNFIRQAVALRKLIDVAGDGYMQNAIAALINGGELKRHLKKAKKTYHQRMNFLDKLFKERLASYVSYTLPTGGMAIWVKLREDLSVTELFRKKGLVHISRYYEGQNAFRFGFASMDESELDHAVSVLHGELRKIEKL